MIRFFRRLLGIYLIIIGMAAHLALGVGVWVLLNRYQLTINQAAVISLERAGVDVPWVMELVKPTPAYQDHAFDGEIRTSHPRILLPELADWSGVGQSPLMAVRLAQLDAEGIDIVDPCGRKNVLWLTSCYVTSGESAVAQQLIEAALAFQLDTPNAMGTYGNGWELALAYDFLQRSPELTTQQAARIERRIVDALKAVLLLLDSPSPSLWHGRTNLAAIAWLCAIVLDSSNPEYQSLITRAQGHFLDVMAALSLTEGWPEGYNYWIQNRALLITLAASAYLNGLEGSRQAERIRETLRRTGYWHIYATRPDQRIEGFGDEGSRVDLKDETRRVIDLMAQLTDSSILAGYSHFLEELHGSASYYRTYRWGLPLFNDPRLQSLRGDDLSVYSGLLPTADLFGRDATNLAYMRSNWGPDATFISFKAGHSFAHHGHYDAGHFTVFKGAPLAINSSTYSGITSPHRLHYAIRSVAKNTLLVMRPGEEVMPNRLFDINVADGGQRLVMPTGSAIRSVRHWYDNLSGGLHLQGAMLEAFEHEENSHTYIRADLSSAYNTPRHDEGGWGGKLQSAVRQLIYLPAEDRLVIFDRVAAVEPTYTKKWLLHTVNRPDVAGLKVLRGELDNGILESAATTARVANERGRLVVKGLYPEDAILRLVGGLDYQYYVESDGDDSTLDGTNFSEGSADQRWFDVGFWRIELQPTIPRETDDFLVVLSMGLDDYPAVEGSRLAVNGGNARGALLVDSAVVFVDSNNPAVTVNLEQSVETLRLLGLPPLIEVVMTMDATSQSVLASTEGVAVFNSLVPGTLSFTWR